MVQLSIILVNYNNPKLTQDTIDSIKNSQNKTPYEIIVVNNCDDLSLNYVSKDKNIIVLEHIKNNGFGNGCNYGARYSNGNYILFLNNDTLMQDHTLDSSLELLKDKNTGAVGVRTLLKDNTLDHGCKRGFPTPLNALFYYSKLDRIFPNNKKIGAYRQLFIEVNEVAEVDSVSGSFLMTKKEVFEQIGGFDETFFMYGEDLDLCYRIKNQGYKIIYNGKDFIYHLKGQSGLSSFNPKTLFHFYDAMKIFYKKNYEKKYNKLVTYLVYRGIDLKYKMALKQMNK